MASTRTASSGNRGIITRFNRCDRIPAVTRPKCASLRWRACTWNWRTWIFENEPHRVENPTESRILGCDTGVAAF